MNPTPTNSPLQKLRWGLVRAETFAWERYFRVETRRQSVGSSMSVPALSVEYEPLPFMLIRRALGSLLLNADDVFLDYGAGLGRALLMAARFRLKRVLGVELLASLAKLATQNVLAASHRLRSPVEVFTADALTWEVPDDVTIIYLFNPFVGEVMEAVLERIHDSLERRPRHLRVLYARPNDRPDLFASRDWLKLKHRQPGGIFHGLSVGIYESSASTAA